MRIIKMITLGRILWSFVIFSQPIRYVNVWKSVWWIWIWIVNWDHFPFTFLKWRITALLTTGFRPEFSFCCQKAHFNVHFIVVFHHPFGVLRANMHLIHVVWFKVSDCVLERSWAHCLVKLPIDKNLVTEWAVTWWPLDLGWRREYTCDVHVTWCKIIICRMKGTALYLKRTKSGSRLWLTKEWKTQSTKQITT